MTDKAQFHEKDDCYLLPNVDISSGNTRGNHDSGVFLVSIDTSYIKCACWVTKDSITVRMFNTSPSAGLIQG